MLIIEKWIDKQYQSFSFVLWYISYDMKEVEFDKPRIVSTVILGIFLVGCLVLSVSLIPMTWAWVKEAAEAAKANSEDPEKGAVAAPVVAFALSLGMILAILVYIGTLITSSICLPFAIKNKKSTLKPIRIISYVYDGLFGAVILLSIIKLILAFAGV